jgi:hypothetical protein
MNDKLISYLEPSNLPPASRKPVKVLARLKRETKALRANLLRRKVAHQLCLDDEKT